MLVRVSEYYSICELEFVICFYLIIFNELQFELKHCISHTIIKITTYKITNMRGFESFTTFKNNIKDSKHIFDITLHLYNQEVLALKDKLPELSSKVDTIKTSTNLIEHSAVSLYNRLQTKYPNKLKQLLLINLVTSLEVYLTDVILEVFNRDIKPFKVDENVNYQRNYLLNLGSIDELKENIIKKDFRNLTSGGLTQIVKYYKRIFNLDIKTLGIDFNDIEEIHTRRHIYVHRNGLADDEYCLKYPSDGIKVNSYINSDNQYVIDSFNKVSNFGGLINRQLLKKFPETDRNIKYKLGNRKLIPNELFVMIEIVVKNDKIDILNYFDTENKDGKNMLNNIVKIAKHDSICYLFLNGSQHDINGFYNFVQNNENLILNKTVQI